MERRFSMNDFEESLREQADDFKMIPSKKVWHGIYNDIHPGRRWPSITVALLLICTLVFIGQLNLRPKSPAIAQRSTTLGGGPQPSGYLIQGDLPAGSLALRPVAPGGSKDNSNALAVYSLNLPSTAVEAPFAEPSIGNNSGTLQPAAVHAAVNLFNARFSQESQHSDGVIEQPGTSPASAVEKPVISDSKGPQNAASDPNGRPLLTADGLIKPSGGGLVMPIASDIVHSNDLPGLEDLQQINFRNENIRLSLFPQYRSAAAVKAASSKHLNPGTGHTQQRTKVNVHKSWLYYIAPQLNSVLFYGRALQPLNNNNYVAVSVTQKQYRVLLNPAFGFEGGVQMNYALGGKLTLTAGLHVTYSGYNIISNDVHPTFANLILKNPKTHLDYINSYITHYGDGTGLVPVTIRNYSLQTSLPVGIQYGIVGSDKVRLNVAGDLEPSIVLRSNAYILSSDGNNYITDPGLVRRLNMSSNFGIFISFTSAKYKWQIGPDVRYQWFSTYKADYTVKEHLIDYGIRLGISPFRK